MRRHVTIILQFAAALLFGVSAVLNFIGARILLGIAFLALTAIYLALGIFYLRNYKG
jgi:hypothetical protein